MTKFQRALDYVLKHEGIDSDHPLDRGGRTRYGITEATARRHGLDVRKITRAQAARIYRADYWRYDGILDEALAIKVFDFAVNAGVERANELLQQACNCLGSCLHVDGVIGPKTLLAANSLRPGILIRQFAQLQKDYYLSVVSRNPSQKVFLDGWIVRAERVPFTEAPQEIHA